MSLKITVLVENIDNPDQNLVGEHGLSLYIEYENYKILFDTGQTGLLLTNAEKLHKQLNHLDYLIVSHGHYDHSGGVTSVLNQLTSPVTMCVGEEFFESKYKLTPDGTYKKIGNYFEKQDLKQYPLELFPIKESVTCIAPGIFIFKNFLQNSEESIQKKFYIKQAKEYKKDTFADEIALGFATPKGLFVCVGCAHRGIINLLNSIKSSCSLPIYAVLGGSHLVNAEDTQIQYTINAIKEMGISQVMACHCTGEYALEKMKQGLKEQFRECKTGTEITVVM